MHGDTAIVDSIFYHIPLKTIQRISVQHLKR